MERKHLFLRKTGHHPGRRKPRPSSLSYLCECVPGQATLLCPFPHFPHPSPGHCFPAGAQSCRCNGLNAGPVSRWGVGPGGVADLGHCSRALSHEKRLLLLARAARVPPGCLGRRVGTELGECAYPPHRYHASRFSSAQGRSGQGLLSASSWVQFRLAPRSCPPPRIHTQTKKLNSHLS